MSRYDYPRFIIKTLFKIINTTKSGFRIVNCEVGNNFEKQFQKCNLLANKHLVYIQSESPLVNLTMAG